MNQISEKEEDQEKQNIKSEIKKNEILTNFTHDEFLASKFSSNMDRLEESNENQEKEILNLMYLLHSYSKELEIIKKAFPEEYPKKQISNFKRSKPENDTINNFNTSAMSSMRRRSVSNNRILEKNAETKSIKTKFNLFSPKVSINIGGHDEFNETKNKKLNNSIGIEDKKSFSKNLNRATLGKSKMKNEAEHENYNTNNKTLTSNGSNKKLNTDSKINSSLKTTPKKKQNGKSENDENTAINRIGKSSKTMKRNIKSKIELHEDSQNSDKLTPDTLVTTSTTKSNTHQNKISFKFEPKKKIPNKEISNDESITNSVNNNRNEFSNNKGSFKSEDNNHKFEENHRISSENINSFQPNQIFLSNKTNSNIMSFISSIQNKKIFMKIFSFLKVKNNLKNISREMRLSFLEHILKNIENNKSLKTKQIENNKDDISNLEFILELEIMTNKEDKIKGYIK